MTGKQLRVTLVKSKNGRLQSHVACLTGLGIKRLGQTSVIQDTPENRGMINRVAYMLKVEEV